MYQCVPYAVIEPSIFLRLFYLMIRRPPRSTRTDTLFPYTTLFRSSVRKRNGKITGCKTIYAGFKNAGFQCFGAASPGLPPPDWLVRSEEHTSELQSLMRISYAVFCLKIKKNYSTCQSLSA